MFEKKTYTALLAATLSAASVGVVLLSRKAEVASESNQVNTPYEERLGEVSGFDGKAYDYASFDLSVPWETAESNCQADWGGHLVSLHDENEWQMHAEMCRGLPPNAYVDRIDLCWIGARNANGKTFADAWWTDGSPFDAGWSRMSACEDDSHECNFYAIKNGGYTDCIGDYVCTGGNNEFQRGYICKRLSAGVPADIAFEFDSLTDESGAINVQLQGGAAISGGVLHLADGAWAETPAVMLAEDLVGARSLEVRVMVDELGKDVGDSVVSLAETAFSAPYPHGRFEGILFGENFENAFQFGSDWNQREAAHAPAVVETAAGVWRHVVLTLNEVTDEVKVYVDGQLSETHSGQGNTHHFRSGQFQFLFGLRHKDCNNPRCYLDGKIDFVRAYLSTLTQAEVSTLFANSV